MYKTINSTKFYTKHAARCKIYCLRSVAPQTLYGIPHLAWIVRGNLCLSANRATPTFYSDLNSIFPKIRWT